MTLSSGQTVTGVRTIAAYLSALSECKLLGSSALEPAQVDQWLEYWQTQLESYINDGPLLKGELRVSQLENIFGFRQNTNPQSTDPLLTPYKISGKMKIKKPRTINGTRFNFINKFSLPENFQDGGRVAYFRLPSHLSEGFVSQNQAQNKLEYQQA